MSKKTKELKKQILKDLNNLTGLVERCKASLPGSRGVLFNWFGNALNKIREELIEDIIRDRKEEEREKRARICDYVGDIKKELEKRGSFGAWFDIDLAGLSLLKRLCELENVTFTATHDNQFLEFRSLENEKPNN